MSSTCTISWNHLILESSIVFPSFCCKITNPKINTPTHREQLTLDYETFYKEIANLSYFNSVDRSQIGVHGASVIVYRCLNPIYSESKKLICQHHEYLFVQEREGKEWTLVGGKRENNENPEETLMREANEENLKIYWIHTRKLPRFVNCCSKPKEDMESVCWVNETSMNFVWVMNTNAVSYEDGKSGFPRYRWLKKPDTHCAEWTFRVLYPFIHWMDIHDWDELPKECVTVFHFDYLRMKYNDGDYDGLDHILKSRFVTIKRTDVKARDYHNYGLDFLSKPQLEGQGQFRPGYHSKDNKFSESDLWESLNSIEKERELKAKEKELRAFKELVNMGGFPEFYGKGWKDNDYSNRFLELWDEYKYQEYLKNTDEDSFPDWIKEFLGKDDEEDNEGHLELENLDLDDPKEEV